MKKEVNFRQTLNKIKHGIGNIIKNQHKNQIIIYIIAFMLVAAGYLNYVEKNAQEVSLNDEEIINNGQSIKEENNSNIEVNKEVNNNKEEVSNSKENDVKNENIAKENDTSEKENMERNDENIGDATLVNSNDITENKDYYTNSKLERDNMYSQMLENYQKILNNTNVSEEQKSIASQEIKNINNIKNSIMICENLISIKGFEDSVIFINGESVNVVVRSDKLSQEQVAQIQNIVTREMNSNIENIHIMTH